MRRAQRRRVSKVSFLLYLPRWRIYSIAAYNIACYCILKYLCQLLLKGAFTLRYHTCILDTLKTCYGDVVVHRRKPCRDKVYTREVGEKINNSKFKLMTPQKFFYYFLEITRHILCSFLESNLRVFIELYCKMCQNKLAVVNSPINYI